MLVLVAGTASRQDSCEWAGWYEAGFGQPVACGWYEGGGYACSTERWLLWVLDVPCWAAIIFGTVIIGLQASFGHSSQLGHELIE
jgi:hypothetical protein